jgi:hypothetical protein
LFFLRSTFHVGFHRGKCRNRKVSPAHPCTALPSQIAQPLTRALRRRPQRRRLYVQGRVLRPHPAELPRMPARIILPRRTQQEAHRRARRARHLPPYRLCEPPPHAAVPGRLPLPGRRQ